MWPPPAARWRPDFPLYSATTRHRHKRLCHMLPASMTHAICGPLTGGCTCVDRQGMLTFLPLFLTKRTIAARQQPAPCPRISWEDNSLRERTPHKRFASIIHIFDATKFSLQGIASAARTGTAFRQELFVLVALPLLAALCSIPAAEIFLLLGCWLLVLAAELLNTAVENICNLISIEYHPIIKIIKDCGSGSVFIAIGANICLWFWMLLK